jgi:hypothetical protein
MDVTGSGTNARVVMGHGNNAAIGGYTIFQAGGAAGLRHHLLARPHRQPLPALLGLTFGANANEVDGKVSSDSLYGTSYTDRQRRRQPCTSTAIALTSGGESQMDYANIGGSPILAGGSIRNDSTLRRLQPDRSEQPRASGLGQRHQRHAGEQRQRQRLRSSSRAVDRPRAIRTATIYAMATNQGISAYTFVVPAPGSVAARPRRARGCPPSSLIASPACSIRTPRSQERGAFACACRPAVKPEACGVDT